MTSRATTAATVSPSPSLSSRETLTFRSRQFAIAGTIVALAPLVLLFFNRNWFLTRENVIDAWHYVGFFEQYTNPLHGPGAYKLARLPWILTGYAVHSLFPPLTAAYVLHGLFLCATPLTLFAALHALLRRVGLAAVVATLFAFYTHAHGSGSWDYHNTGAGLLYLLSVLMLALPAVIEGRRLPLVLTGVIVALTVHTNITLVNFLPVLAFVHVRTVQEYSGAWPRVGTPWTTVLRIWIVQRATWVLLGGVLVSILLGVINHAVGREFFFSGSLLSLVKNFVSDPEQYQTVYWRPWSSGWLPVARYLALPAAVFVAGAGWFAIRRPHTDVTHRLAATLVGQFLFMVVLWTAWQADGQTALDPAYMAYPLTLSAFVALGGFLVPWWPDALERHGVAAVIGTAAASAISLSGVLDPVLRPVEGHFTSVVAIVGCVVFTAALLQYLVRPGRWTAIALIAMFILGNRLMANRPALYAASDACKIEPAVYSSIVDGASWLWKVDPARTRVRTWFDEQEQLHPLQGCTVRVAALGTAITAVSWVPYVVTPFPMPGVDDVPAADVRQLAKEAAILAIVTNEAETVQRWRHRLENEGLSVHEMESHTTHILGSEFTIHALEIADGTALVNRGSEAPASRSGA